MTRIKAIFKQEFTVKDNNKKLVRVPPLFLGSVHRKTIFVDEALTSCGCSGISGGQALVMHSKIWLKSLLREKETADQNSEANI